MHTSCACLSGGILNGAFFYFCYAAGYTNRNGGLHKRTFAQCFFNKILQHFFCYIIIGNNTFAQRTNGNDIAWRSAQHTSCLFTHRKNGIAVFVNGYHGRFPNDDALSLDINQNRCRPQVDPDILAKTHKV